MFDYSAGIQRNFYLRRNEEPLGNKSMWDNTRKNAIIDRCKYHFREMCNELLPKARYEALVSVSMFLAIMEYGRTLESDVPWYAPLEYKYGVPYTEILSDRAIDYVSKQFLYADEDYTTFSAERHRVLYSTCNGFIHWYGSNYID